MIVILVTGRILDDLRRVAGDLNFVDGVVAENGALVHFPGSGQTTILAPLIPGTFVARLKELGIPFGSGQCLVDADASSAHRLLDVIRDFELPIVLLFNRSRVVALAQGVSKATGLKAALDVLRASPRNTVAIGDAENDHELLRLAEVGVNPCPWLGGRPGAGDHEPVVAGSCSRTDCCGTAMAVVYRGSG